MTTAFVNAVYFTMFPRTVLLFSVVISEYVLLLLYFDDVIIASSSEALIQFRISYSGNLTSYLNIGITHDHVKKTVCMSQERYIEELFEEFQIPKD